MTRIYLPLELAEDREIALPDDAFRHLVQVLRLHEGDAFIAFNGDGSEFDATLVNVGRRAAGARLGAQRLVDRESPLQLTLAQCVSKGERMEYALQKAVELGVQRIQPLLSTRSVVRVDSERWEKKLDHWRGILIAACEQCGRTRLPELAAVMPLDRWLAECPEAGLRLVLDPGAALGLGSLAAAEGVCLLIGPEGGLAPEEVALALRHSFTPVRTGPRVLRTETAGVAVMAALQALWGDWR